MSEPKPIKPASRKIELLEDSNVVEAMKDGTAKSVKSKKGYVIMALEASADYLVRSGAAKVVK